MQSPDTQPLESSFQAQKQTFEVLRHIGIAFSGGPWREFLVSGCGVRSRFYFVTNRLLSNDGHCVPQARLNVDSNCIQAQDMGGGDFACVIEREKRYLPIKHKKR